MYKEWHNICMDLPGLELEKRPPNSEVYRIAPPLRDLIYQLMQTELGKDPHWCEYCWEEQSRRCEIHHERYAGATLYDLRFLCRRCQMQPENKNLP